MKKINLIIVTPGFPENEENTVDLSTLQMFIRELSVINRFDIHIIALQYPPKKIKYNWYGISVQALGGNNKKGIFKIFTLFSTWVHLKRLLKKENQTVVMSYLATDGAFVAGYFCRYHGIKHFCWIIGQDALKKNKYMPLISKKTIFMAMSAPLKIEVEKNFNISVKTILPNGLNLSDMPEFEKVNRIYDIICVGSLIKLKRTAWVITLVHDLSKVGIIVNCAIIGTGPELQALQSKISECDLQDHIKLLGVLPHRETIRTMFKSKILFHPSSYEGFSTVCLEALYAGCHVVTTCNPLQEKNEQMHPADNYEDMFAKCKTLLSKELQYMSYKNYTTEQTVRQFLDML